MAEQRVCDLGDDPTSSILSYSDLRGWAACAAASSAFNRCLKRLSPHLEHRLVLRRFPLLATVAEEMDPDRTAPRELFYSQMYLFEERQSRPLAPTRGLDDYIFSLQIECNPRGEGDRQRESIFVGIGSPTLWQPPWTEEALAAIEFHPPADVFARVADHFYDRDFDDAVMDIHVRVMATKRFEKGRARLGQGSVNDFTDGTDGRARAGGRHSFIFRDLDTMRKSLAYGEGGTDARPLAGRRVDWRGEGPELLGKWSSSAFTFTFNWDPIGDNNHFMTVEDVCLALEHYVTWV